MILANGCNITKSEKFKGVWILSVPTVYIWDYIRVFIGQDRAVQLIEIQFRFRFRPPTIMKYNNRDKTIMAPFPAVRFHSSIKAHFHV